MNIKIVTESTGWQKEGDLITQVSGEGDVYSCTITSYVYEGLKERNKIMSDNLFAVIRPKPFWIHKKIWRAIVFYIILFEREKNVKTITE